MSNTGLEKQELNEQEILNLLVNNYEMTEEEILELEEDKLVEMIAGLNLDEEKLSPEKGEQVADENESGKTDVKKASNKKAPVPSTKGDAKSATDMMDAPKPKFGGAQVKESTKNSMIKGIYDQLDEMTKEELAEKFELINNLLSMSTEELQNLEEEKVEFEETPKVEIEDLEIDVKEDVEALVKGEELTEEFKEKASTIFEAAVQSKVIKEVNKKADELKEEYDNLLNEKVEELREEYAAKEEELTEKVDSFLNYAVEEWMSENKLQVESGIRNELIENFMSGLKNLFTEHYISVPEEKTDLIDELFAKVDSLEESLNEEIEKNVSLNKQLVESSRTLIMKKMSSDLTKMEASKLEELTQSINFTTEEELIEKIQLIKENYFGGINNTNDEIIENDIEEGEVISEDTEEIENTMKAYVSLLSKTSKNK